MDTVMTEAVVKGHCRQLHLPTVGARCMSMDQEAIRNQISHSGYLSALLEQELQDRADRRAQRRVKEARFPATKRLSNFLFAEAPIIPVAQIASLAAGDYIGRAENVLLIGDSGTGKPCWRLGWDLRRASRATQFASPPLRRWSTNCSKLATRTCSPAWLGGGRASTC
jgi:IstB-like ATP binding protein